MKAKPYLQNQANNLYLKNNQIIRKIPKLKT